VQHSADLITTIAASLGLALVLGFLAVRLKLPALVGYLVAGIIIGPATPGFVADLDLARQLADIGVMLLMFGIGLHFSFDDLLAVRRIVLPGAIIQMTLGTLLGFALASSWGWDAGASALFGLALSVASTVVLLRALESGSMLKSMNGRIAVGWLVVQDLAMILIVVLVPPLSALLWGATHNGGAVPTPFGLLGTLAFTLGQVALFVALMLFGGRRLLPWFLWQVARTGSRELFTLCIVAAAVGIAYGAAKLFGVSFALGAFLAGMVLGESHLSHRAAQDSLPFRDAFSVLFFVAMGMLYDPGTVARMPMQVLAVVACIVLGSPLVAFAIVLAFRYPLNTALVVAASLAQIGEFSFIVAGLGRSLDLLPQEAPHLIFAGALITITVNPLLFRAVEPLQRWIRARSGFARALERPDDPLAELPMTVDQSRLTKQVVLVGYGRVGRRIAKALAERGIPFVVAEQNRELVERLRERGVPAVSGNAAEPAVLIQAHIARARILVVATPDTFQARQMMETARALNPGIDIVVRTHSDEEADLLRREGLVQVFMGEHELALGMTRHVLEKIAAEDGVVSDPETQ
jgi:CPA2 family monovalent cation:H+ antiporter-2